MVITELPGRGLLLPSSRPEILPRLPNRYTICLKRPPFLRLIREHFFAFKGALTSELYNTSGKSYLSKHSANISRGASPIWRERRARASLGE